MTWNPGDKVSVGEDHLPMVVVDAERPGYVHVTGDPQTEIGKGIGAAWVLEEAVHSREASSPPESSSSSSEDPGSSSSPASAESSAPETAASESAPAAPSAEDPAAPSTPSN